MAMKFLKNVFKKEKKISWTQISYNRFGTFIPLIDWDEELEDSDLMAEISPESQKVNNILMEAAREASDAHNIEATIKR